MVAPNSEPPPPPRDDPMGPPATPVEVECIHCGNVYMSDAIRWKPDPNGPDGGWWVCPIEGCDGAGFCFDIYPTDPKVAEQFGVHTWDCPDEGSEEFDDFDDDDDGADEVEPPARGATPPGGSSDRQPPRRRKLKVDVADLAGVMDFHSTECQSFLDLSDGQIHTLDSDMLRRVEDDEVDDDDDIPAWQVELLHIARAVLEDDDGDRFAEIPQIESGDSFRLMQDFISQLADGPARQRLEGAIAARKPFRRFKDALMEFPDLREQWFAFEASAKEAIAREWLNEIGVDLIEP